MYTISQRTAEWRSVKKFFSYWTDFTMDFSIKRCGLEMFNVLTIYIFQNYVS